MIKSGWPSREARVPRVSGEPVSRDVEAGEARPAARPRPAAVEAAVVEAKPEAVAVGELVEGAVDDVVEGVD